MDSEERKAKLQETKEELKKLFRRLKGNEEGEALEAIKKEFQDTISNVNPLVIAMAENELVKEGFSTEELFAACDLHLMIFKNKIENPDLKVPEDHAIFQFQQEHRVILGWMEELRNAIKSARKKESFAEAAGDLEKAEKYLAKLMEAENHNVRQENTLFPVLEKHGIEQPPAIMWAEHTEMKEEKKALMRALKNLGENYKEEIKNCEKMAFHLLEKFSVHTQKEEHILYVTALQVITDEEWKDIKTECDELGYFAFK